MNRKILKIKIVSVVFGFCLSTISCDRKPENTIGSIISFDKSFAEIIPKGSRIEVVATGLKWPEGPVWIKEEKYLLFSDNQTNSIYKWNEKDGLKVFLKPSGYTGLGKYSSEPGSNGLLINKNKELVAAEHGDRRISIMNMKKGGKKTLADSYNGKRLNSPNDIVQANSGDYYFTDPPYGLGDNRSEIGFSGVYKISQDGKITLIIDNLKHPNGITFSPDGKILYVAETNENAPSIWSYDVNFDGSVSNPKKFFDVSILNSGNTRFIPDGLKRDKRGNLYVATFDTTKKDKGDIDAGPGCGISVISPAGKLLGRIETRKLTTNSAIGDDGYLYITSGGYLCRVKLGNL